MHDPVVKAVTEIDEAPRWYRSTLDLLGRRAQRPHAAFSMIGVHDAVTKGLPGEALNHLLGCLKSLPQEEVLNALGISGRTVQRRKLDPKKMLNVDQSGRTWRFAQILALASEVLGDQADAEKWLSAPAIALDQRRPIDLLSSPVGTELVEQLLRRLEWGVYT
jgi:putative toxin-antitoxin system antitoxin component (TIGR02293 family)